MLELTKASVYREELWAPLPVQANQTHYRPVEVPRMRELFPRELVAYSKNIDGDGPSALATTHIGS